MPHVISDLSLLFASYTDTIVGIFISGRPELLMFPVTSA